MCLNFQSFPWDVVELYIFFFTFAFPSLFAFLSFFSLLVLYFIILAHAWGSYFSGSIFFRLAEALVFLKMEKTLFLLIIWGY